MQRVEGTVLAGKYALVSKLGQGGMGSVWRAEHVQLRSPVAIKLIDGAIVQNPEALARFMREAQSAAALRSPHVVQILDFGADQGVPYIAMELLEGESLAGRLERQGRLSPEETAHVLTHVGRAVSKAHETGVVHRDLKPDNIFLVRNDEEEVAKVLDFGIAKASTGFGLTTGSATRTGAVLGTPYYMSPEQAEGTKLVDHRSDLWALGVIAFECLLGRRPFDSDALGSLLLAICTRPIPLPSSVGPVPPGFDAWFARACARELSERFQNARELTSELRRVCSSTGAQSLARSASASGTDLPDGAAATPYAAGTPATATPYAAASPTSNSYATSVGLDRRATPWLAIGASALVVTGLAGAGIWFFARGPSAPEPALATIPARDAPVAHNPAPAPAPPDEPRAAAPVEVAPLPAVSPSASSSVAVAAPPKAPRAAPIGLKAAKPATSAAPAPPPKPVAEPKASARPTSKRVNLGI